MLYDDKSSHKINLLLFYAIYNNEHVGQAKSGFPFENNK
jgi:hypothetical protein